MAKEQQTPIQNPAPAQGSPPPAAPVRAVPVRASVSTETRAARSGTGVPRPPALVAAVALWAAALAAGAAETALGAAGEIAAPSGMPASAIAAVIAVRVVVTAVFGTVAVLLWRGQRWARPVFALGLGVVGLLTLVGEPIAQIVSGTGPAEAFGVGDTPAEFLAVRAVHIAAVLCATAAMYLPSADRFLRAERAAPGAL